MLNIAHLKLNNLKGENMENCELEKMCKELGNIIQKYGYVYIKEIKLYDKNLSVTTFSRVDP